MKKNILFIAMSFLCISMHAQFTISYSGGYSSHDMRDLKNLVTKIQDSPPASTIGVKNVDDFSENFFYQALDIGYRLNIHEFGLKAGGYSSTGSKLSKKDYSGEFANRFIINGTRAGIYYKNYFYTYKDENDKAIFSFYGEISPGLYFTEIKNNSFFIVNEETLDSFDEKYTKTSFAFLIQAGTKYYLTKNINLQIGFGYDIVDKAKIEDLKPTGSSVNWSGIRFSGGIGYIF